MEEKPQLFQRVKKPERMTKAKFLALLPEIRKSARKLGYAVGLHGSLTRDFDLIACPWTEEAVSADELALAIYKVCKAKRWRLWWDDGKQKPYGRKAYAFDWGYSNKSKNYIDLSIMPKETPHE